MSKIKKFSLIVILISIVVGSLFTRISPTKGNFMNTVNSFSGQSIKVAGEGLNLVEVPEFSPVEEVLKNLSNVVIYQLVDLKEFEEFVNSPNRPPYAYVVGVDMVAMKKAESERKSPNEPFTIKFEKVSNPLIEPNVWHIDVPISGANLQPGYGDPFGPYSGYIYVSISLSWSPSSQPVDVGIQYTDSNIIIAHRLTGGSSSTGFNVDPTKSFYVWVVNPDSNSTNITSYQGIISLWAQ